MGFVKGKFLRVPLYCVAGLVIGGFIVLANAGNYYDATGGGGGYWGLLSMALACVSGYFFAWTKYTKKIEVLNTGNATLELDIDAVKNHIVEIEGMYDKKLGDTIDYYENEIANLGKELESLRGSKTVTPVVMKSKVTKSK